MPFLIAVTPMGIVDNPRIMWAGSYKLMLWLKGYVLRAGAIMQHYIVSNITLPAAIPQAAEKKNECLPQSCQTQQLILTDDWHANRIGQDLMLIYIFFKHIQKSHTQFRSMC